MTGLHRLNRAWRSIASITNNLKSPHNRNCNPPPPPPPPRLRLPSNSLAAAAAAALATSSFGIKLAFAEAEEVDRQSAPATTAAADEFPLPPHSPPSTTTYLDFEEIAKNERSRIQDLLNTKGMPLGSYPNFTVAVKGQKITIKFEVPSGCEIPQLIAHLVSHLGTKLDERGAASHMLLRAWDSSVAWQLTLGHSEIHKENGGTQGDVQETDGDLCILIYRSLISSDRPEIEFIKKGSLSPKEIDAFTSVLRIAGTKSKQRPTSGKGGTSGVPADKSISNLESIGVRIYGLDEPHIDPAERQQISWENIAGYDQQKREIEDTILLALQSPEVYDEIARGTRRKYESNRPRAVLFEGPPGTGKTSCARVISSQAGVPLLYVPLEVVMSKYYGESERLLGKVFSLANELPNGAIIFLDEVDSFAAARDSEMHEATRRMLSVLLRQIDGFEQDKKVVVIGATNRKQDLDPALVSRFDSLITFGLPDEQTRKEIAAQYAKHLQESELLQLAKAMEEMSGRDIRDVCQHAERSWASKIIRGQATKDGDKSSLPPLQEYIDSAESRRKALLSVADLKTQTFVSRKKQLLDFT